VKNFQLLLAIKVKNRRSITKQKAQTGRTAEHGPLN